MKLHFLGANRQVTGSRYCLEVGNDRVLIDCGMFQERDFASRNWNDGKIKGEDITAMLLTHAHIDHCGLIPRFFSKKSKAPIFATEPTADLAEIMLRDSARIQLEDARYKAKRHKKENRKGPHPPEALYTDSDVSRVLKQFEGAPYEKSIQVTDNISASFHEAGHILGSAMIQVDIQQGGKSVRVIFSGDIGQHDKPIIRDPHSFEQADFVVMESTYGDRTHEKGDDIDSQLREIVSRTIQRGGSVVIPVFAVERAQELMFHLAAIAHDGLLKKTPVFLDSPMAVDVTYIFRRFRKYFDEETLRRIESGQRPLEFEGLEFSRSVQQSKAINRLQTPSIILSTSGMCTAGRIKHHLKRHIGDSRSTILFVGYQAGGTLGRQISQGNQHVRIHGQQFEVKAEIARLYGFSGHADRDGLLNWIGDLEQSPKQTFLTHGDMDAATALQETLTGNSWKTSIPEYEQVFDLA